jgi:hypothetical protein
MVAEAINSKPRNLNMVSEVSKGELGEIKLTDVELRAADSENMGCKHV